MPVPDALKVLSEGKRAQVLDEKIAVLQGDTSHLRQDVRTLSQRIVEKEAILADMLKKDVADSIIIAALRNEIAADKEAKTAFENYIKKDDKLIKQLKRQRTWASIGGLVGIAATIFLFTKK